MRRAVLVLVVGCGRVDFGASTDARLVDGVASADGAVALDAPSPIKVAQAGVFVAASQLKRTLDAGADTSKFTFASWYKSDANTEMLLCAGTTAQQQSFIWADMTDGRLVFQHQDGSVMMAEAPIAAWAYAATWVHVVVSVDTAQAVVSDRVRIWLDGEPQSLTNGGLADIAQNQALYLGAEGVAHTLGNKFNGDFDWSGKLAETYVIFGHALDPSSFIVGTGSATRSIAYTGPIDSESAHFDYEVAGMNLFSSQPAWEATQLAVDDADLPY